MSITVEKYEDNRYYVSVDGGQIYLVDVQEFDGNGWCNCRDFECRHQPKLVHEEESGLTSPKRHCKHIIACLEYLDASNPTTESVTQREEVIMAGPQAEGKTNDTAPQNTCLLHSHDVYGYDDDGVSGHERRSRICSSCTAFQICSNEARTIHQG